MSISCTSPCSTSFMLPRNLLADLPGFRKQHLQTVSALSLGEVIYESEPQTAPHRIARKVSIERYCLQVSKSVDNQPSDASPEDVRCVHEFDS